MIRVEALVFDYPGLRALDHVSFEVAPQTVTALVGPNGAGKTTLLRCMAALDRPNAGRVTVAGLEVHEQPRASHRKMGFLPDFFGLYDELTVAQCLAYRAEAQGVPPTGRAAAVAEAARRLAIEDRLGQKAGTLSRGLRQRLAIAQAVIHGPAVLLLDEPAAGLDPAARAGLAGVLRQFRIEGMTIVVSSHILAELEDYSTHMLILDRGRVLEHRAITGGATAPEEGALVEIALAGPDDRLPALLAGFAGLRILEADSLGARVLLADGADRGPALLRILVEAGLPVAAFAPERRGLQEAYLARLQGTAGA